MSGFLNIKRFRLFDLRRLLMGLLSAAATGLVALHYWFPHMLSWVPNDIQAAIAIGIFGLLADRLLSVDRHLNQRLMTVHASRQLANDHLLTLIRTYGASKIDLLQFSGDTAVNFLRAVALIGNAVHVRLFVVDNDQARRFDADKPDYHVRRIEHTVEELCLISKDNPTFTAEVFCYFSNAEVSAIIVDDFLVSVGWNRSHLDPDSGVLRMRGHNSPAINLIDDHLIIKFIRDQIDGIEKSALEVRRGKAQPHSA